MPEQTAHDLYAHQFVTFSVDGECFAADIRCIREVVRTPEITTLPTTAGDVIGVVNVRGRILPVADAGKCFDLGKATDGSRMLVVDRDGEAFGLLVDSVDGVAGIDLHTTTPLPPSWTERTQAITTMARIDGRLIAVVDLREILLTNIPSPD